MTPHRLLPPLLLTLLVAACPGGALARCPGCGQGVQAGCPGGCVEEENGGPPAEGCAEAGGCLRREGQQCGVYTPNCTPGLQCRPPEEDEAPLRALLLGRGRCRARVPSGENPKESKPQAGSTRPQDVNHRDQQKNSGTSTTASRSNHGGIQDTEMGPCRRHLDSVLQQLQTEIYRGSQTLYVPNCDHRGFYRKRQCRSSQGQRRGPCWCVDRMGQPLPGSSDGNGNSPCPTGSSG
ncbi:Insulin-like growth factor-binding protein 6 [Camelus dromedarius]|uniref:Insulin-like growth factor-binding protein 6 n=4 Tax=Camelidae TaxID=9835 RepID=A0A5N4DEJ1_CAMDR|nr:insulin-like growth factor-binding protein 6 [Camelus dromedarius]XP_031538811.1 insulin-like growth factor-binding protein 6 [Vicugna pacos]XP_032348828.1 insulin-like growth factor-binding protein 6 [Camelus ferus]KAB1269527.1 Insulin-like growth factor-binding protein 6 [Camelus dromedarius]